LQKLTTKLHYMLHNRKGVDKQMARQFKQTVYDDELDTSFQLFWEYEDRPEGSYVWLVSALDREGLSVPDSFLGWLESVHEPTALQVRFKGFSYIWETCDDEG